jgi:hypothetical protein
VRRREFITLLGGATAWPLGYHFSRTHQPPANVPDPNWFGLTFGTLVVALTIVAIITLLYALNRGPIERKTGTGPSHYAVST